MAGIAGGVAELIIAGLFVVGAGKSEPANRCGARGQLSTGTVSKDVILTSPCL